MIISLLNDEPGVLKTINFKLSLCDAHWCHQWHTNSIQLTPTWHTLYKKYTLILLTFFIIYFILQFLNYLGPLPFKTAVIVSLAKKARAQLHTCSFIVNNSCVQKTKRDPTNCECLLWQWQLIWESGFFNQYHGPKIELCWYINNLKKQTQNTILRL